MIFVIGGIPLSGRYYLARNLATRLNADFYNLQAFRFSLPRSQQLQIAPDALLSYNAQQFLQRLPLISKMHEHIVVTDHLHRTGPRNLLLDGCRSFADVRLVWVEVLDETIRDLAQRGEFIEPLFEKRMAFRAAVRKDLEPIAENCIRFEYSGERDRERFYKAVAYDIDPPRANKKR